MMEKKASFHSSLPSFFWVCFGGGEAGGKQSISDLSSPISPSPFLASHDHRFPICWMAEEKNQRWRGSRPFKKAFLVFSVWQTGLGNVGWQIACRKFALIRTWIFSSSDQADLNISYITDTTSTEVG